MRERVWKTIDQYGNEVIKHRPRIQRDSIGEGWEHNVVKTQHQNPPQVLKTPNFFTAFYLKIFFEGAQTIKEEIRECQNMIQGLEVYIPRTRVWHLGRGTYQISQEIKEEDNSIYIFTHLQRQGNTVLLNRFIENPSNFVSNQGRVYWLDPLKSHPRILERLGIMHAGDYFALKVKAKTLLNKVFSR